MPDSIKIVGTTITIGDKVLSLACQDECKQPYAVAAIEGFILALSTVGYKCITPEDDCSGELIYSFIPVVPEIN